MRNITLTCPNCREPNRAVGDPDEKEDGHEGKWYCFACESSGTYTLVFEIRGVDAMEERPA